MKNEIARSIITRIHQIIDDMAIMLEKMEYLAENTPVQDGDATHPLTYNHYRIVDVNRLPATGAICFKFIIDNALKSDLCLDSETFEYFIADLGMRPVSETEYESINP